MAFTTAAIVVAAGAGERFGSTKQLAEIGGQTVIEWSVKTAAAACQQVVVVLSPAAIKANSADETDTGTSRTLREINADVVAGGATRLDSVRAGLSVLREEVEVVVVHDAVRPGATKAMFEAVIGAVLAGADAAVPMLRVFDTLKRIKPVRSDNGSGVVLETLDRNQFALAQTPQAFAREVLTTAYEAAAKSREACTFTDDASLVEAQGGKVLVVEGDFAAHKITTPVDLDVVAALMGLTGSAPNV